MPLYLVTAEIQFYVEAADRSALHLDAHKHASTEVSRADMEISAQLVLASTPRVDGWEDDSMVYGSTKTLGELLPTTKKAA